MAEADQAMYEEKRARLRNAQAAIFSQIVLDTGDQVLQLQLAFFQPRQLQLIAMGRIGNCGDRNIELAMLLAKLGELRLWIALLRRS